MTVDFADWMAAWKVYRRKKNCYWMLLLAITVIFGAFAVMHMDDPFFKCGLFILFTPYAILVAGGGFIAVATYRPESFVVVACRRFHDYPFEGYCRFPEDRLPEDGTRVMWWDDGKIVEGRLFVNGTRVTLAPDVGSGE